MKSARVKDKTQRSIMNMNGQVVKTQLQAQVQMMLNLLSQHQGQAHQLKKLKV